MTFWQNITNYGEQENESSEIFFFNDTYDTFFLVILHGKYGYLHGKYGYLHGKYGYLHGLLSLILC